MNTFRLLAVAFVLAAALAALPAPAAADGPFQFHAITPCRLADTRNPGEGPALSSNVSRTFQVQGKCGVPVGAKAAALNATITQPTGAGHLILFPSTGFVPGVSTLNFTPGEPALANGAIVPLSAAAQDLGAQAFVSGSGTVHLILDVTGYFQ